MENTNALSDRTVLKEILKLLLVSKIHKQDLQFQHNIEIKTTDDYDWFTYVEKSGWVFQGHKNALWIRLVNPSGIRIAHFYNKDIFVAKCRALLRKF